MHISLFKQAALVCVSAYALTTSAAKSQEWTSFQVDTLNAFSFAHAHRDDGFFLYGSGSKLYLQDGFGTATMTEIPAPTGLSFDPSFIATRSGTEALLGRGGFSGASGLHLFDPSGTGTAITTSALATLQNYAAVFWRHPTSTREGWIIMGGNVDGGSNLTFVSTDGSKVGSITGALSDYPGGLATTANGDVYTVRSSFGPPEGEVIKFTAAQIDAAVAAVIAGTPAPLNVSAASVVFQAAASGSLAVDSLSRVWVSGYQIPFIQAHDPGTGITRQFKPDHAALLNAAGAPTYSLKTFSRSAESYVSFLANDSAYTTGSGLVIGYKRDTELKVRSVQFTTAPSTVDENAGVVDVTITITPAPTQTVTVPISISGTASSGADFTMSNAALTFDAVNTTRTISITLTDDSVLREADETLIIKLSDPTPVAEAGLGAPSAASVTLTIRDNDKAPIIARTQTVPALRVGTLFTQAISLSPGPVATRWSVKGQPPGLSISAASGIISGTPTTAGEYDQVVVTASNSFGSSDSIALVLRVEEVPSILVGTFTGLVARHSSNGELGALISLTTTGRASCTGKVVIGTSTYSITRPLDVTATTASSRGDISHAGQTLVLTFSIDANGALTGSLSPDATITGMRAQTGSTRTGIYNFRAAKATTPPADQPQGATYASVSLTSAALARITGKLADGSTFTMTSPLSTDGSICVYQKLYTTAGSIHGKLALATDASHTISGVLTWSKPPQAKGTLYRAGWATPISVIAAGGKYRPSIGATNPLDAAPVASTANNARLVIQDGGLSAVQNFPFHVTGTRTLRIATPQRLTITNATGLFSSTLTLGSGLTKRTVIVQGLLVPDAATDNAFDSTGYGYFILPVSGTVSRSGAAIIERL